MLSAVFVLSMAKRALPWLAVGVAVIGLYSWQASWHRDRGRAEVRAEWDAARVKQHAEYQAEVARLTTEAAKRQTADRERQQALEHYLAAERTETERLRAALSRAQLVTRPEPTDADPHPDARLSEPFRLCWNAHWTGDPADRAACQAAGSALPDPGGR